MSKVIKFTQQEIEEMRGEFDKALQDAKLADGKFSFTKSVGQLNRKAKLYFTPSSYIKMQMLVADADKEIAWHGVAKRHETEKDAYVISDILVYPQIVTGANVDTDQEKYQMWLMGFEDDVFNNIRMQGHSHVNMGVTPSGVDTSFYEKILDQLEDDMFYVFLIWNKRGDNWIKIYDLAENVLFETVDITLGFVEDGVDFGKFLTDARASVQDKVYTPAKPNVTTYGQGWSVYQAPQAIPPKPGATQPGAVLLNNSVAPASKPVAPAKKKKKKRVDSYRNYL
ncbi:MAG: hypothetical protein LUD69_05830 [Oscillospiraceae bacterium]|nr:hypothetical protein [Oscillospiraceae bacterium]